MIPFILTLSLFHFLFSPAPVNAGFTWSLSLTGDTTPVTTIPSCGDIQFTLDQDGTGTPTVGPFLLHMYPERGIPTIVTIPEDNLFWLPSWLAGARLLLELVDANGNSGGVSQLITVVAGTGRGCSNSLITTSPITLTASATSLTSCDPLQLTMSGGTAPYTISLVAQGSISTRNTTLRSGNDQFTWINRADPTKGTNLLAVVTDSAGVSSAAGRFITLAPGGNGVVDTTCSGKFDTEGRSGNTPNSASSSVVSSTKTKASSTATAGASSGPTGGTSKAIIAVAVVVGVLFALVVVWLIVRNFRSRRDVTGFLPTEDGHGSEGGHGHPPPPPPRQMQMNQLAGQQRIPQRPGQGQRNVPPIPPLPAVPQSARAQAQAQAQGQGQGPEVRELKRERSAGEGKSLLSKNRVKS